MKKALYVAVLSFLLSAPAALAQQATIDKAGILRKIEKSNEDIANPKKNEKITTWMSRGDIFVEAETAVWDPLPSKLSQAELRIMFGSPTSQQEVAVGNSAYMKFSYPYFDAYVDESGAVRIWDVTDIFQEGAADLAAEAYNKASDLDAGGKNAKRINKGMNTLFNNLYVQGGYAYALHNYKKAADLMGQAYGLTKYPSFGPVNQEQTAGLAYDAGIAYYFAAEYSKSVEYLDIARNMGYENDGDVYYYTYWAYKGLVNADNEKEILGKAKEVVQAGMRKYPGNTNLIQAITDVYVQLGEDPKDIIPIVQGAITESPENPELWNGLGRLNMTLNDYSAAIEAFKHVTTLTPNNSGAYFNLGLAYLTKADNILTEVNRVYSGTPDYTTEMKKVFDVYYESIAPLEKSHELDPTDINTVELLRGVTFRLRDMDGVMDKYNKYDALFKQLKGE